MTIMRFAALALSALVIGCAAPMTRSSAADPDVVIEVVTFQLKPGVTLAEFRPLDRAVESQHVARQPGFISRESAADEDGRWLVIVHWRSMEDAEASMATFSSAPATERFMSSIDVGSMVMTRYLKE